MGDPGCAVYYRAELCRNGEDGYCVHALEKLRNCTQCDGHGCQLCGDGVQLVSRFSRDGLGGNGFFLYQDNQYLNEDCPVSEIPHPERAVFTMKRARPAVVREVLPHPVTQVYVQPW